MGNCFLRHVDPDNGQQDGACTCEQEQDDVGEKTSPIELQYDETDSDKLTYFGAKLKTNAEGEHRLVEVKEDGLAQQLHLKNDDIIIELNGADVTDVSHDSLVLSLRDLGTRVQFVVNRANKGSCKQGRVYFRLGPADGDVGYCKARIVYKQKIFADATTSCSGVTVEEFVLPRTQAFKKLAKYELYSANRTSLQLTLPKGAVKNLEISQSGAYFTANNANVCLYEYITIFSTRPPPGTIAAYASVPANNLGQYGLRFIGNSVGPIQVMVFLSFMKTKGIILENRFFFSQKLLPSAVDITPVSNPNLHVSANANANFQAVVETSIIGTLTQGSSSDCSRKCIINRECQSKDLDE